MTAIVLLFLTGALLLAAEVMLPGAIAGIIGGAALLLGSVLAYMEFGVTVGSGATFAALLLVAAMLYAEFVWLPRTKVGRGMVVQATISGQSQPMPATSEVIGETATALTMLAPSGFVEVAGQRGAVTVEVNREPTPISGSVDYALHGAAGEILPRIVEGAFGGA